MESHISSTLPNVPNGCIETVQPFSATNRDTVCQHQSVSVVFK